ncbi:MAG: hypothetical protein ABIA83_00890 [Patescibacteria group bacterium]
MRSPESMSERQFLEPLEGSFWSVYEYSEPGEQEPQKKYVAKRLKQHFLFPRYSKQERTVEETQEVANYLRRERDHLRRSYDKAMPNLIPKEKIVVLPSKEDHPSGEILSVQEKLNDYVELYKLDMDKLTPNEREEVRKQLDQFITITKSMISSADQQDPKFSNAIPDITHLSNLAIEQKDEKLLLRMYDTNYVLPVDSERAVVQHHLERCAYRLLYIEHHLLGRSLDELFKDPFYTKIVDFVKTHYPNVPNIGPRQLYDAFFPSRNTPPWQRDQIAPDKTIPE